MEFAEWSEWIENLLATLVTLRVFGTHYGGRHEPTYLPFITQVSNRAPNLEYFTIFDNKNHYGKLVHGEWVLSDAGFPSARAFDM
jgi:hypothetical protein